MNLNPFGITRCVHQHTGVDPLKDVGRRRRELVESRMLAFFFLRKYTAKSLTDIGKLFACPKTGRTKDHATVLHGLNAINNYLSYDARIKQLVSHIDRSIKTTLMPIELEEPEDMLTKLKMTQRLNYRLIHRAIYLKDCIDRMPKEVKRKYFANDQYIY